MQKLRKPYCSPQRSNEIALIRTHNSISPALKHLFLVSLLQVYLCCWRSWVYGVRSMQKAHTSPHGWLQPCGAGRWCQAAGPQEDTLCCSEVSPLRWQCCPQLYGRKVCRQTTDRGSPWRAVAASSPGYLWSCGWSDSALGYAKALQKNRDITNTLNHGVVKHAGKKLSNFYFLLTKIWVSELHTPRKYF